MTAAALLGAALAALAGPFGWLWLTLITSTAVVAIWLAVGGLGWLIRSNERPAASAEDSDAMMHRWLDEPGRPDAVDREIQRLIEEGKRNG